MADWTTLIDSAVGVGGIPSGTTVTALRDNPVAIAEGAAGAPKVEAAGLATGTAERNWVLGRVAGAAFGAVGTYAFLYSGNNVSIINGNTYAGSGLFPAGIWNEGSTISADDESATAVDATRGGASVSGTWRAMGRINVSSGATSDTRITLYLRIS